MSSALLETSYEDKPTDPKHFHPLFSSNPSNSINRYPSLFHVFFILLSLWYTYCKTSFFRGILTRHIPCLNHFKWVPPIPSSINAPTFIRDMLSPTLMFLNQNFSFWFSQEITTSSSLGKKIFIFHVNLFKSIFTWVWAHCWGDLKLYPNQIRKWDDPFSVSCFKGSSWCGDFRCRPHGGASPNHFLLYGQVIDRLGIQHFVAFNLIVQIYTV